MTLEDQILDARLTESAERIRSSALARRLAESWERRAAKIDARKPKTLAEIVLAQSFRERAEELRAEFEKSPSTLDQRTGA